MRDTLENDRLANKLNVFGFIAWNWVTAWILYVVCKPHSWPLYTVKTDVLWWHKECAACGSTSVLYIFCPKLDKI